MNMQELQERVDQLAEKYGLEIDGEIGNDPIGAGTDVGVGFRLTDECAARVEANPELKQQVKRAKLELIQSVTGSKAIFRYEGMPLDDVRMSPEHIEAIEQGKAKPEVKMLELHLQHEEAKMLWGFAQIGACVSEKLLAITKMVEEGEAPDHGSEEQASLFGSILADATTEMMSQFHGSSHVLMGMIKLAEMGDMLSFASTDLEAERTIADLNGMEEVTLASLGFEDVDDA